MARSGWYDPPHDLRDQLRGCYGHDVEADATRGDMLAARLTRVPPNPYTGIIWLIEGEALLVERSGAETARALPRVFVCGPSRHGYRSLAAPFYRSFGVVFQPGALAALAPEVRIDRDAIADARGALPARLHPWLDNVAAARSHAERHTIAVDTLRAQRRSPSPSLTPWSRLALASWRREARNAVEVMMGWSDRHFRRRARAATGLRAVEVERLLRLEAALRDARDGASSLAEIAARHGFSDQSHFSREVRAVLSVTPATARDRMRDGGSAEDWILRL